MTAFPMEHHEPRLDFSQFHPLDHRPGDARCRAHYPYGLRSLPHHLKLAWTYQWSERMRRVTLCRLGRHDYVEWFTNPPGVTGLPAPKDLERLSVSLGFTCSACYRKRPY